MKFTIEVISLFDNSEEILTVNVISPKWAKIRAQSLSERWKLRNASAARVLNQDGRTIYSLVGGK
jgi:hypothetical protein